ncbi:hypothetical protein MuYL_2848 [Mucilaginibacter xinganensis]|uniref:Uncharacterized protein n=1 Tax=Mucilaginibacter xinganensis TaxID=1234841 RepID=A0A223NY00_9SPHI|nr:hypothetical protein MuYL_2848 [Mucilaginibacter xinganensis]
MFIWWFGIASLYHLQAVIATGKASGSISLLMLVADNRNIKLRYTTYRLYAFKNIDIKLTG